MKTSLLPDVQRVNINHKGSVQDAISSHFHEIFFKKKTKHILLSILSFGAFPYRLYKHARHETQQALSARKLFFFNSLNDQIEHARKEHALPDPRQSLNAIFMKVQIQKASSAENALEFRAVYTPLEILLFITNPVREKKKVRLYRLETHHFDYLRTWHQVKKKARINQYRQIQNINQCHHILKKEFHITPKGIQDRLCRTVIYRKNSALLTQFKDLSKAFQEIVIAFQDFEELNETNPSLFKLIKDLSHTSEKDIEILQTYLASRYIPRELPLANRRQLIQIGNQHDVFYSLGEEELNLCALILNQYQWTFLLSIQEVSEITLKLLDWAFETSPDEIEPSLSFQERISEAAEELVRDHPESFPMLYAKVHSDASLSLMTQGFANELNREWPAIDFYDGDTLMSHISPIESVTVEHLVGVYRELLKLVPEDTPVLFLLEGALSSEGKAGFQSAIEAGVNKLLGEKSEYFLPILTNKLIKVSKKSLHAFEIQYSFEQIITKKGQIQHPLQEEKYLIVTQPIVYKDGKWLSPEAKVKTAVKKKHE